MNKHAKFGGGNDYKICVVQVNYEERLDKIYLL